MNNLTERSIRQRKRLKQLKNRPDGLFNLVIVMSVIISVVMLGRLVVSNTYATRGQTIDQLEVKLAKLQEENWALQKEAANLQSLQRIESIAREDLAMSPITGEVATLRQSPLAEAR